MTNYDLFVGHDEFIWQIWTTWKYRTRIFEQFAVLHQAKSDKWQILTNYVKYSVFLLACACLCMHACIGICLSVSLPLSLSLSRRQKDILFFTLIRPTTSLTINSGWHTHRVIVEKMWYCKSFSTMVFAPTVIFVLHYIRVAISDWWKLLSLYSWRLNQIKTNRTHYLYRLPTFYLFFSFLFFLHFFPKHWNLACKDGAA